MAYLKIDCDALFQYWRYTMIYRFVFFEAIDQAIITKKRFEMEF